MSQHMYHSEVKMRKIHVVPPKVGKILKIRKIKYRKARPNSKKFARKKELRKKIFEVAGDCLTIKCVTESGEIHPSKLSKKLRQRTSSGTEIASAEANISSKHADSGKEMKATALLEKVLGDDSSETSESESDYDSESLSDSEESSSHHRENSDVEMYKDDEDNDSNRIVNTSMDSVEYKNPFGRVNFLLNDPCSRIQEGAKAEFHHLSDKSYLLILRHPGQLYFRGSLSVTPVSGITSFLGYEFTAGMNSHVVYSPKGLSSLCFSTTGRTCLTKAPKIPGLDKKILQRLSKKDSGLLIEPASGEHWNKLFGFFNRLLKFNPLEPSKGVTGKADVDVEADLGVKIFQPSDCVSSKSFYRESSEWDALSQNIRNFGKRKGLLRVMVFGGKGVGKSTFMRFLVNQWLTSSNESNSAGIGSGKILFLDFDPGQSEFVPPGCVSVTLVSKPLLGPNYTHLQDPERMLCLGELDVSRCPKWYLYCADDLVKFCSSEKYLGIPWFINTMGFCKGIGADLAVELIRLCRPTHVVQLTSIWRRRNFEPLDLLSWQMIKTWKGQIWNPEVSDKIDVDIPEYSYHQIKSLAENSEKVGESDNMARGIEDIDSQWGLPAWQLRELCILAYFSKIVKEPKFSILDAVPHRLMLPNLVLSLPSALVKPQYVKSVFNASLVALCSLGKEYYEIQQSSEDNQLKVQISSQQKPWLRFKERAVESDPKFLFHMPLAPCFGFGLVRGIDDSKKEIYVLTPLSSETTVTIDCLATGPKVGSIPAPIMMDSWKESKQEDAPYLMKRDQRTNMNRAAPRVFQSHLANSGPKQKRT